MNLETCGLSKETINQLMIDQWVTKPSGGIPLFLLGNQEEILKEPSKQLNTDGLPAVRLKEEELAIQYRIYQLTGKKEPRISSQDQEILNGLSNVKIYRQFSPLKILRTKIAAQLKQLLSFKIENFKLEMVSTNCPSKTTSKTESLIWLDSLFVDFFSDLERYLKQGEQEDFDQSQKKLTYLLGVIHAFYDPFRDVQKASIIPIKKQIEEICKYLDFIDRSLKNREILLPYLLIPTQGVELGIFENNRDNKQVFISWLKEVSDALLFHAEQFNVQNSNIYSRIQKHEKNKMS